eukprot:359590-Chlamydomonas_euryale.AAC.4
MRWLRTSRSGVPFVTAPSLGVMRVCAYSLLKGSGFARSMGGPRRFTPPLDPLAAVCMIYAPCLSPHTLQHPTGFGMAGSGIAEMGCMERLWDACAAHVPPCAYAVLLAAFGCVCLHVLHTGIPFACPPPLNLDSDSGSLQHALPDARINT